MAPRLDALLSGVETAADRSCEVRRIKGFLQEIDALVQCEPATCCIARITAHIDNSQSRLICPESLGKLSTGNDTGHNQVGQEHVERARLLSPQLQRFGPAGRSLDPITLSFEDSGRQRAHCAFVLHHED